MKKFIALAIAIVMMAALAVPAFAATLSAADDSEMIVSYESSGTYTVTIPDTATVGGSAVVVSVAEGALLESGKQIKVTVAPSTGNAWTLVNTADPDDTLAYTINGGDIAVGGTVLTHAAGKTDATEVSLTFALAEAATKAGNYSQTITFTVTVENIPTES